MKLRNKKTGEIVEAHEIDLIDNYVYLKIFRAGDYDTKQYNSLAELNEEWEDYEEPKKYWYIESDGYIDKETYDGDDYDKSMIEIGNYFETKEEAEKAVEKLKAWERLKDDGFRFKTFYVEDREIVIRGGSDIASSVEMWHDLDTLFGDEE